MTATPAAPAQAPALARNSRRPSRRAAGLRDAVGCVLVWWGAFLLMGPSSFGLDCAVIFRADARTPLAWPRRPARPAPSQTRGGGRGSVAGRTPARGPGHAATRE